jgi:phospholipase B1
MPIIDFMQKEFPRTIVNLINALNVAELDELNVGLFCPTLHRFLCPCAAFPPSKEDKQRIIDYFHGYSINAENLVKSGRYDTTDDFTVVYQPFFRDFRAPRRPDGTIDTTYFAPDCFHFR